MMEATASQPKTTKHNNITMPDAHGYQVRIVRRGHEFSRYFSSKVWGGEEKALEAAIDWRDMKRASLPRKLEKMSAKPKNNSTGINGISKVIHFDKRRGTETLRYQVSYRTQDGRQSVRTFQVGHTNKLTPEDDQHALKTAIAFRKEYELARSLDEEFNADRYLNWKKERFYEK